MRIITWNIWFGEFERERRREALWAELATRTPDILCLQEVTPDDLESRGLQTLLRRGYWQSDDHISSYDVLLLSRIPVLSHERVPLPSVMGRELLVVRLATTPPLTIATVHLESTASMTAFRCRQLADIHAHLAKEDDVLLVGDMNFPAGDRPEAAQLPGWRDAWAQLHPRDPGYTVDSRANLMRALMKPDNKQARIDRVFHRGPHWQLGAISRTGTTHLADDPTLFVSDHFGLQVDVSPTAG